MDIWDSHAATAPLIRNAVVYVATPDNYEYCGPLTNDECAKQIARSVGPSGSNAEYLYRLADALRHIKVSMYMYVYTCKYVCVCMYMFTHTHT